MSRSAFSHVPKKVSFVNTKNRKIRTKIPVPQSLAVLKDLAKYESRSMHGQLPVVWDRAVGHNVYDKWGNCWIDFTSTIFVANVGHGNQRIIEGLVKEIKKPLLHTYTFANESRALFLKKLIQLCPKQFQKAFLLSAGTEATECAVKIMRMHGQKKNKNRVGIISFKGAMHGRTMGAQMLKGNHEQQEWIGYCDPNIYHLPFPYPWIEKNENYNWAEHFRKDLKGLKKKGLNIRNICGFMIESYLGWGAIFYPEGYIKELYKFAKKNHILVTFDEIQGGFGRTGKLFVYQHYGVEPDLLCLGKAISSSLPLSAVIGSRKLMDIPEFGSMSSTHSGNPVTCVAGIANIDEIRNKQLVKEAKRKGEILFSRLIEIKKKFPHRISYICGKGLVAGVIFKNVKTGEPDHEFPTKVCELAMQKGLLLVYTGRESIKIGPPLTITDSALLEGLEVLEEAISKINTKG